MPDYTLKSKILNEHPEWVQAIKDSNTYAWANAHLWYDKSRLQQLMYNKSYGTYIASELLTNSPELYRECEKIANADVSRRKRLQKRIKTMLFSGTCYFLTLTFSDDVLNSTSNDTRRRYVSSYLKDISSAYVGNIDFGKNNGREHYHAVVRCDSISREWSYGFSNSQLIRNTDNDSIRLAKYVGKLTNHAIKQTTKRNALIYSR